MEESKELTTEELNNIEDIIPAKQRLPKIRERASLRRKMPPPIRRQKIGPLVIDKKIIDEYANAGGIHSLLDPINPSKIQDMGEPTVEIKISEEDKLKISEN